MKKYFKSYPYKRIFRNYFVHNHYTLHTHKLSYENFRGIEWISISFVKYRSLDFRDWLYPREKYPYNIHAKKWKLNETRDKRFERRDESEILFRSYFLFRRHQQYCIVSDIPALRYRPLFCLQHLSRIRYFREASFIVGHIELNSVLRRFDNVITFNLPAITFLFVSFSRSMERSSITIMELLSRSIGIYNFIIILQSLSILLIAIFLFIVCNIEILEIDWNFNLSD